MIKLKQAVFTFLENSLLQFYIKAIVTFLLTVPLPSYSNRFLFTIFSKAMKARLFLAFIVILSVYSCCNDSTNANGNTFTPRFFTNVADAEARWKAYKFTQYTLLQKRSCFCIPLKYPLTVLIDSGGKVVSVRDAAGANMSVSNGTSIETMFANIRALQNLTDAKVEVRYDSVYGYPRYINADPIKQAADDEYMLETTLVR